MPELPEVEVTRLGLAPHLNGREICSITCSGKQLRHPYPQDLKERLVGRRIVQVSRRAKYLLISLDSGVVLVWHLGMTGHFHVLDAGSLPLPHQHVAITLDDGRSLRYVDPRRFGYVALVDAQELATHRWFVSLGPEPLESEFDGQALLNACQTRSAPIKSALMDNHVVVGVGNIYASESLYRAGIHPARPAKRVSLGRLERLAEAIKQVLAEAISAGGSTIRDFAGVDGKPGYFAHAFQVYGRQGERCTRCGRSIRRIVQAGRSTFYCPGCQR